MYICIERYKIKETTKIIGYKLQDTNTKQCARVTDIKVKEMIKARPDSISNLKLDKRGRVIPVGDIKIITEDRVVSKQEALRRALQYAKTPRRQLDCNVADPEVEAVEVFFSKVNEAGYSTKDGYDYIIKMAKHMIDNKQVDYARYTNIANGLTRKRGYDYEISHLDMVIALILFYHIAFITEHADDISWISPAHTHSIGLEFFHSLGTNKALRNIVAV